LSGILSCGGLKQILTSVKRDEEVVLRYVLDNSGTGFINQHKFSEFLKGFGPVHNCLKNVKTVLSSKWFHGFLSRSETELLLRDQAPGTFLIRFSSSAPGSFALAFVQDNKKSFFHILVNSVMPLGFQVQEQDSSNARTFPTLHELVDFYSVFLQIPYCSDIPFESWFEGDITTPETVDALSAHEPGTFLVRFSNRNLGSYAVSFVGPDLAVNHSLIEHEGIPNNQYRITADNQYTYFNELKEVMQFYGDALKFPLKSVTNPEVVEATQQIIKWKQERSKHMDGVHAIVESIFDVNQIPPFTINKQIFLEENTSYKIESIVSRLFVF